jgi:hypothetical protein
MDDIEFSLRLAGGDDDDVANEVFGVCVLARFLVLPPVDDFSLVIDDESVDLHESISSLVSFVIVVLELQPFEFVQNSISRSDMMSFSNVFVM